MTSVWAARPWPWPIPPPSSPFPILGGNSKARAPWRTFFDEISNDSFFGEKTWEKAESAMQKTVLQRALEKAELTPEDLDYILAGDLLNQCIGSSFGLRDFRVPSTGSTVPAPPWERA